MTRLILHCGTHKTGTTALQFYFHQNADWLKSQGVIYDTTNTPAGSKVREQHWLAKALAVWSPKDQINIQKYHDALRKQAGGDKTVLLSTERIYREHCHAIGGCERGRSAFLDRVADFAQSFEAEAVLVLRRADRLAEAYFKEGMANSLNCDDFTAGLKVGTARFDYADRIAALEARFSKVHVLCYEDLCRAEGGLVNGFSAAIGLPVPKYIESAPVRKSVTSPAALWLQRAKSTSDVSKYEQRCRWTFALTDAAQDLFENPGKKSFWPDTETRDAFFAKSVEGFAFGGFWSAPAESVDPLIWTAAEHSEAESRFEQWKSKNWLKLAKAKVVHSPAFAPLPSLSAIGSVIERAGSLTKFR